MTSPEYTFSAPQFYSELSEVVCISDDDDFFDAKESKDKDNKTDKCNSERKDSNDEVDGKSDNKENICISDSDDESLNSSFSKIKIKNKFDGIDLTCEDERKSHPMLTRQDVSILSPKLSLELRSRSVFKESLVLQGRLIGRKRKTNSLMPGSSVVKYRSLAESIYHFQKDTPPRFRGQSSKSQGFRCSTESLPKPNLTAPSTPHFLSDQRLRHCTHHCLNQEERELKEIEEAKQQFKPQQLNKKIFDPPKGVDRSKQFTVPKPFNLTEQPPKKIEEPETVPFVFKARPVPRNKLGVMNNIRVSTNKLPILLEEGLESEDESGTSTSGLKEANIHGGTKVKPFSFDTRDKLRAIRKKEKIQEIIESEKKVANFKAQPLPSFLSGVNVNCAASTSSRSSFHHHEWEDFHNEFKARPAVVLQKEPFHVKKSEKTPTKPFDIKLNTEFRAQQRHEYDEHRRTRDEEIKSAELKLVEEEVKKEEEEISQLRKETVHKPLPLPKYISKSYSMDETYTVSD